MSNDSNYYNLIKSLGFFPDTIARIANLCDNALQDAGCTFSEINEMYETASREFSEGNLDYSDISNSLITEYLGYTKEMLEKKLSKAEVTYYVNCSDTHLYVNGEEYFESSSLIADLLYKKQDSIEILNYESIEEDGCPCVKIITNSDTLDYDDAVLLINETDILEKLENEDIKEALGIDEEIGDSEDLICYAESHFDLKLYVNIYITEEGRTFDVELHNTDNYNSVHSSREEFTDEILETEYFGERLENGIAESLDQKTLYEISRIEYKDVNERE